MEKSNSTTRNRSKSSKNDTSFDYFLYSSRQASDSVKLQIQKATRERDQANANTMQIRTDFEKLLLQSNQVRTVFLTKCTHRFDRLGYPSTSSSTWFDTKSFS